MYFMHIFFSLPTEASVVSVCSQTLLLSRRAGALAGGIDIAAHWLSDLKVGVCLTDFWFNHEHCCWMSNETFMERERCPEWQSWAELITGQSEVGHSDRTQN